MEFKHIILEQLLLENRIQQVMDKFTTRRGKNLVSKAAAADPSDNQKYLAWFVRILTNNDDNSEFLISKNYNWKNRKFNNLMELLTFFHQNQVRFQQKDINQYKTIDQLEDAIEEVKEKLAKKEEKTKAKKGGKKIYEDENIFVIMPTTHAASCYYGAGTRWCTTERDDDTNFMNYSEDGYLFYFIVRKPNPDDRVFYKMAMNMGVHYDILEYFDDPDYYNSDWAEDDDFEDMWEGIADEVVETTYYDAPDSQHYRMQDILNRRGFPYSDEVKQSFYKAHDLIQKQYGSKIREFGDELTEKAEQLWDKYHYSDQSERVETNYDFLEDLLRKAGVENPRDLKMGEAIDIITNYLKDKDVDFDPSEYSFGAFMGKYPLEDR